jgi:hypothetical protein
MVKSQGCEARETKTLGEKWEKSPVLKAKKSRGNKDQET